MPKEYMECVASMMKDGKSKDDSQRMCAIAYQKKHGMSVQEAAKKMGEKFSADLVERDAKIFEAGEYPDKGVTITEDDLDVMVSSFTEQPVKIEHQDSPFDGFLGTVKSIRRVGKDLMGKIAFNPTAWALAEQAGAKKLSAALHKDPFRLAEVSLVTTPRISTASVFCFSAQAVEDILKPEERIQDGTIERESLNTLIRFAALVGGMSNQPNSIGGDTHMADEKKTESTEQTVDFAAEKAKLQAELDAQKAQNAENAAKIADLQFANRKQGVEVKLDKLVQDGKLTPACRPFAEQILLHGSGTVTFSDGATGSVADAFEKLLEAAPKVVQFGEVGPKGDGRTVNFSDGEINACMKLHKEFTREQAIEFMAKYSK